MRIGEAAELAGLTPRALRYYEQQGLIDASRTYAGHREYDDSDVERLRLVRGLRDAGLTVADVVALVSDLDYGVGVVPVDVCSDSTATDCALNRVSSDRIAELDQKISQLTATRDRLSHARKAGFGTRPTKVAL